MPSKNPSHFERFDDASKRYMLCMYQKITDEINEKKLLRFCTYVCNGDNFRSYGSIKILINFPQLMSFINDYKLSPPNVAVIDTVRHFLYAYAEYTRKIDPMIGSRKDVLFIEISTFFDRRKEARKSRKDDKLVNEWRDILRDTRLKSSDESSDSDDSSN